MKLSVFNNYIQERWEIVKINTVNSYQIETAYFAENWANVLSTIVFTLTAVLFLNVLYGNVKMIATYTRNEIWLFSFIGQINFYLLWTWSMPNIETIITDVNRGNLDLILTKPLPALFYVTLRRIRVLSLLRDGLPTLPIWIFLINWHNLSIQPINMFLSVIIFICGQIAIGTFQFFLSFPAFWQGEARSLLRFTYIFSGQRVPYEGLPDWIRIIFMTVIPNLFSTAICTSVLLGKLNGFIMTPLSILVAICAILLKQYVWNLALKNYTSASS